jgi:DNA helicase II / ATP-dependent DNA helicase PcrA
MRISFQDILTEEIPVFIINILYAIFDRKKTILRNRQLLFFLSNLHTELENHQLLKLESVLSKIIKKIRQTYSASILTGDNIKAIIVEIIALADRDRIKANFPGYRNLAVLDAHIKEVQEELISNYTSLNNIVAALDMLIGKDTYQ